MRTFVGMLLLISLGCGGKNSDRPATARVTGTVLYNGSPVDGATVAFIPKDGRSATGVTSAAGEFTLQTYDTNDGAVLGNHTVTITPAIGSSQDDEVPPNDPDSLQTMQEVMDKRLPQKYSSADTSGLTREVADDGQNDFTFELTD